MSQNYPNRGQNRIIRARAHILKKLTRGVFFWNELRQTLLHAASATLFRVMGLGLRGLFLVTVWSCITRWMLSSPCNSPSVGILWHQRAGSMQVVQVFSIFTDIFWNTNCVSILLMDEMLRHPDPMMYPIPQ